MKSFWKDFKSFISKGNIVDLAIAVVIGGAFSKIVTSLVSDIIMPLIGLATGGTSIKDLKWVIKAAVYDGTTLVTPENALMYGNFLQVIIDFLIIALCIFVAFRIINASSRRLEKLKKEIVQKIKHEKQEGSSELPEEAQIVLTDAEKQEILLTEIRDLLKTQSENPPTKQDKKQTP